MSDPRVVCRSAQDVVDLLNAAARLDPVAMRELVDSRVECNAPLAGHPTIQTGPNGAGGYEVGLLGILNGIFGTFPNGWGCITAVTDREDPSAPIRFEVMDNSRGL